MRGIILACVLAVSSCGVGLATEPQAKPEDKDRIILELKKALAESRMENLKLRYERIQREWAAIKKALGEETEQSKTEDIKK